MIGCHCSRSFSTRLLRDVPQREAVRRELHVILRVAQDSRAPAASAPRRNGATGPPSACGRPRACRPRRFRSRLLRTAFSLAELLAEIPAWREYRTWMAAAARLPCPPVPARAFDAGCRARPAGVSMIACSSPLGGLAGVSRFSCQRFDGRQGIRPDAQPRVRRRAACRDPRAPPTRPVRRNIPPDWSTSVLLPTPPFGFATTITVMNTPERSWALPPAAACADLSAFALHLLPGRCHCFSDSVRAPFEPLILSANGEAEAPARLHRSPHIDRVRPFHDDPWQAPTEYPSNYLRNRQQRPACRTCWAWNCAVARKRRARSAELTDAAPNSSRRTAFCTRPAVIGLADTCLRLCMSRAPARGALTQLHDGRAEKQLHVGTAREGKIQRDGERGAPRAQHAGLGRDGDERGRQARRAVSLHADDAVLSRKPRRASRGRLITRNDHTTGAPSRPNAAASASRSSDCASVSASRSSDASRSAG